MLLKRKLFNLQQLHMKKLLFVISLSLLLFSCKKERTIHITAKNAVTGQPYAGLTYYVVQEKTGMSGEEFKTVATGTLDNNGEVFITKKLSKKYSYAIRVEAPPNTCYNKQITFYFANQETVFECPFEFAGCAYLKENITNVNCEGPNDYMILYTSNSVNSLGATGWVFNGCASYSGSDFSKIPMGYYYHEWHVTRSGITNIYYDTIFVQENEYKTYDINY